MLEGLVGEISSKHGDFIDWLTTFSLYLWTTSPIEKINTGQMDHDSTSPVSSISRKSTHEMTSIVGSVETTKNIFKRETC
jgi:hypothetical protein